MQVSNVAALSIFYEEGNALNTFVFDLNKANNAFW